MAGRADLQHGARQPESVRKAGDVQSRPSYWTIAIFIFAEFGVMTSLQRADPVSVLRGHTSDVHTVLFHPRLAILYSGYALPASGTVCDTPLPLMVPV